MEKAIMSRYLKKGSIIFMKIMIYELLSVVYQKGGKSLSGLLVLYILYLAVDPYDPLSKVGKKK
jgi:hypothetical protein